MKFININIVNETKEKIIVWVAKGASVYRAKFEASELAIIKNKDVEYDFNEEKQFLTVRQARLFLTQERVNDEIYSKKSDIEYHRQSINALTKNIAEKKRLLAWRKSLDK